MIDTKRIRDRLRPKALAKVNLYQIIGEHPSANKSRLTVAERSEQKVRRYLAWLGVDINIYFITTGRAFLKGLGGAYDARVVHLNEDVKDLIPGDISDTSAVNFMFGMDAVPTVPPAPDIIIHRMIHALRLPGAHRHQIDLATLVHAVYGVPGRELLGGEKVLRQIFGFLRGRTFDATRVYDELVAEVITRRRPRIQLPEMLSLKDEAYTRTLSKARAGKLRKKFVDRIRSDVVRALGRLKGKYIGV